jgi:two-component system response regulator HydG
VTSARQFDSNTRGSELSGTQIVAVGSYGYDARAEGPSGALQDPLARRYYGDMATTELKPEISADQIRVLAVDDEEAHAAAVAESLERVGYECVVATEGTEGARLLESSTFDIVVTDLVMDDVDGLTLLSKAKQELPDAEVILITGHGTINSAVTAMQHGAYNYLTKPLDINELRAVVNKATERQRLARSNVELRRQLNEKFGFEGVVGNSPQMHRVISILRQIAPTSATVLIQGESGTGKELAAKAIHTNSPRKSKPFVPLNCAAISEGLLEGELFGHVKGAFTGAVTDRKGRFEYANGGTLFLDEIGDMPLTTQIKLLRVIESGEIMRVGSNEPVKVDVRLISATNANLEEAIRQGRFREDLYYRLKVVTIELPPLRQRREDIPLLIDHFLKEFSQTHQKEISSVSPAVRKLLSDCDWPGNVRQLKNTIESMVVVDSDGRLDVDDLPDGVGGEASADGRSRSGPGDDSLVGRPLEQVERHYLAQALKQTEGNREEAARMLGIGERTLYRKIKQFGL